MVCSPNKKIRRFPDPVAHILQNFDAWLVGSAVDNEYPKDYDILVPFHMWHRAVVIIPQDAKPNSFKGWKVEIAGITIDMWPGDLGYLAALPFFTAAYHHASQTIIRKE